MMKIIIYLRFIMVKILSQRNKSVTVTQSAGRVGRKCDGKACGYVIDFVDSFGMYRGWAVKRQKIYKKLDYIC